MGEYADQHIENYTSGRWGMRVEKPREYPKTTKAAIADRPFHIVEVKDGMSMRTNRLPGTKLVVCDKDDAGYWVWTTNGVSGIAKDVCTVVHADLPLAEALQRAGRKPYGPKPQQTVDINDLI